MEEKKNKHKVFWWVKAEGKGTLGRPRCKLEYTIKMNLREIGLDLTQDNN
jgi:hypothetical protein